MIIRYPYSKVRPDCIRSLLATSCDVEAVFNSPQDKVVVRFAVFALRAHPSHRGGGFLPFTRPRAATDTQRNNNFIYP